MCPAQHPHVNDAIKTFQSAGTFGERHIVRTPFEACAIPPFTGTDARHVELARLSQEAHSDLQNILEGGKKFSLTKLRSKARGTVTEKLTVWISWRVRWWGRVRSLAPPSRCVTHADDLPCLNGWQNGFNLWH
ncbi:MAG UNVERIFIED_CONTAM: hypothetical protein LVT10_27535 [Anaerolineae bacterium]